MAEDTAAAGMPRADVRAALLRLRRDTGLPVAFGGLVEPGRPQVRISELSGTATPALRALAVTAGSGLGGRVVALARPCAVTDYSASRQISHEYDVPVAAEGLRSVLAVPVVVRRRVRGVLYGALRTAQPLGDRALHAAVEAARDVEQAMVAAEEARGLLAVVPGPVHGLLHRPLHGLAQGPGGGLVPGPVRDAVRSAPGIGTGPDADTGAGPAVGPGPGPGTGDAAARERMREAHTALRALVPRITDPALRAELLGACELLAPPAVPGAPGAAAGLAPREVDVLAWVAAGATNAATAARLGLRPETVKSYLRSAMRKLGAHTRGEAVAAARRTGALP